MASCGPDTIVIAELGLEDWYRRSLTLALNSDLTVNLDISVMVNSALQGPVYLRLNPGSPHIRLAIY